jgi:DNA-binding IclR family transcriptional regulator
MERNRNEAKIQSLQKGLKVLRKFALEKETWGPRELGRSLGISKSSALRILQTLHQEGFLRFTEQNGKYTIGPDLWRLGVGVNRQMNLITIGEPIIRGYVKEINETIYLFTYSRKQLIFEFAVECSSPLRYHLELGVPYDLHVGAAGKVILAYISAEESREIFHALQRLPRACIRSLRQKILEVEEKGYSFTIGERVKGIIGFAAPIFGGNQRLWGGLTLTIPEVRYAPEKHDIYAALVKQCAAEISSIMNPQRNNLTLAKKESR